MKKALSVLLSVLIILSACGIIAYATDSNNTSFSVLDIIDNIRTIGRTEEVASGIACDWTASGIEFTANCEGDVAITVTSSCTDVGSKGTYNKDCYFTVYIDGVRQSYRVRVVDGTSTVNVAEALESGTHTIKIVKQNELSTTKCVITSVSLTGTFGEKPAANDYVFEFAGDSITSGNGSLDTDNQSSRYSDGTRTYAYITAENFGAEARVTSVSGGTINSVYNQYIKNNRAGDAYDYSLTKPDVLVLAFGTNDGVKTADFWQSGIKQFADAVRQGYNDYNIPIVFVHNLITNDDALRVNLVSAVEALKELDAEKYSNIYITHGKKPSGGHPGQSAHKLDADALTQALIEFGIMPASALKSDATVTMTKRESNTSTFKSFDSVVTPSKSGITGELVSPLDPADSESDTAKAVKYTADGTQETTTDYRYPQVKLGNTKDTLYNLEGISFYINYKDTTDYTGVEDATKTQPKLVISASDQMVTVPINVEDGVTQKVEYLWDEMPNTKYVYGRMINSNAISVSLEMSGECEYTIDNMNLLLTDYVCATNSAASYTYTTGYSSYEVKGITNNYEPETTTTTAASTEPLTDYFEAADVSNNANWVTGWYNNTTGVYSSEYTDNKRACVSKLIKVDSSGSYTFTINNNTISAKLVLREYDAYGNFLSNSVIVESGGSYTPSSSSVAFVSVTIYDSANMYANYISKGTVTVTMELTGEITTTQAAEKLEYLANDCDKTNSGGTVGTHTQSDIDPKVTLSKYEATQAGNYITYTLSDVPAGNYVLSVGHRRYTNRAVCDISTNGTYLCSHDFNGSFAYVEEELGVVSQSADGDMVIRLDITTAGTLYIGYFYLTATDEEPVTGTTVATTTTTTTTATTTAPDVTVPGTNLSVKTLSADDISLGIYGVNDGTVSKNGDDYTIKYYRSFFSTDRVFYIKIPTTVFDLDPVKIEYVLRTNAEYKSGSRNCYFSNVNTKGYNVTTNADDVVIIDDYQTLNTTAKTYSIDLTSEKYAAVKTNKLNYFIFAPHYKASSATELYVEAINVYYYSEASYTVTLDGEEVEYENGQYTLPESTAAGFIAYTDGTSAYEAGETFTVDKDLAFTTVAVGEVKMLKGAAMRYTDGTGIRFYTDVDTDKIDALIAAGYTVTAGTLISPEDVVGVYDLNYSNYQIGNISELIDVTYDFTQGYYTDDITEPCIVGSIVKIQDHNIARNFIGRGYITVTVGDVTKTVYADYADGDIANNTRNIQWIAQQIQNDTNVYPNLEDFKKETVDKYASFRLETAEEVKA